MPSLWPAGKGALGRVGERARRHAAALLLILCGCATARVTGPPLFKTPDPQIARSVVLEPFFETAAWEEHTRLTSVQDPFSPLGSTLTAEVKTTSKPLFAQVAALAAEHRAVLQAVKELRPSWTVTSTAGLEGQQGPVTLVRVVIESNELMASNRPIHNAAFGFGLLIWPLQIYNVWPVEETQRVYGLLERYSGDAAAIKARLVRYETQPDYAFDARGYTPLQRKFGLDVEYEEGLLADEVPRRDVLVQAFSERLAAAVVALVEEPVK